MNREIKFRVVDLYDNVVLDGSGFLIDNFGNLRDLDGFHEGIDQYKPIFYTGLKDKNRKEIYEGDIVNGASFNGSYAHGEVVWWTGGWCIQPIPNIEGITELYLNVSTYEVIGNVYENKDLIEKLYDDKKNE